MSKPIKAKRRLTDISFEHEGAAVALVSKDQGGAANGKNEALILKSTAQFSEEFIEKAQKVQVTMELPYFLEKFFGLWCDEAEILARLMGYEPEEEESYYSDYQDYIEEKLEMFEVLKSAYESESIAEVLSNLNEEQYINLLRDQEKLEKAFDKVDSAKEELAKAKESEQPVVAETKTVKARIVTEKEEGHIDKAVTSQKEDNKAKAAVQAENKNTEVNKMTDKSVKVEKTEEVEMVEKSQFDLIQKALDEQKEALEKAQATIETFEAERKEALDFARKEVLKSVVEEESQAEELFKAVGELSEDSFQSVVDVMKALKEGSTDPMFEEQGVSGEGEQVVKSALRASLEAKYNKNK